MRKSKRIFFLICVISFFIAKSIEAQELHFCESVSDDGTPIHENTVFKMENTEMTLFFLVKLENSINCTSVNYKLYLIDDIENEKYSTTIIQENMKVEWSWFYKPVTFYAPGTYMVYVKDCKSKAIVASKISITY